MKTAPLHVHITAHWQGKAYTFNKLAGTTRAALAIAAVYHAQYTGVRVTVTPHKLALERTRRGNA